MWESKGKSILHRLGWLLHFRNSQVETHIIISPSPFLTTIQYFISRWIRQSTATYHIPCALPLAHICSHKQSVRYLMFFISIKSFFIAIGSAFVRVNYSNGWKESLLFQRIFWLFAEADRRQHCPDIWLLALTESSKYTIPMQLASYRYTTKWWCPPDWNCDRIEWETNRHPQLTTLDTVGKGVL